MGGYRSSLVAGGRVVWWEDIEAGSLVAGGRVVWWGDIEAGSLVAGEESGVVGGYRGW